MKTYKLVHRVTGEDFCIPGTPEVMEFPSAVFASLFMIDHKMWDWDWEPLAESNS